MGSADLALPADSLAVSSSDPAALFNTLIYQPIETAVQNWITSPSGIQVDDAINQAFGVDLIGNGAAGTAADPTGGAGGLLLGDGGAGYDETTAGVAGGDGGAAGLIGDGGAGGSGGHAPAFTVVPT